MILIAAAALLALGAAPAHAAEAGSPWWQLLTGSRPTNLQPAPDQSETQEVSTVKHNGEVLAAAVEVGGEVVGCLGAGSDSLFSAEVYCEIGTGFPATETREGFEEMLEATPPYDEGVEVSGGPAGGEPFLVATPGRWVAEPLRVSPLLSPFGEPPIQLGSASAKVTSEGSGRLVMIATDLGDAPLEAGEAPLAIVDRLPSGVQAYGVEAFAGYRGEAGPTDCELPTTGLLECSFESELLPYEAIELEVLVALKDGAGEEAGEVTISGGDGPTQHAAQTVNVSAEPVPFGLERFSAKAEEEGGTETAQAGAHPFQLTQTFQWNSGRLVPREYRGTVEQPALPRNTGVTLPAGFIGSATAVKPCRLADFLTLNVPTELVNPCPASSAVGVASVTIIEPAVVGFVRLAVPVFALPPERGEPARLGFVPAGVPVFIDTAIDPSDSYRIDGVVRNASQAAQVLSATVTLWGSPGDARHDSARGWGCTLLGRNGGLPCPEPLPGRAEESPFLRMPVSCSAPLEYLGLAEPWNAAPGAVFERPLLSAPPPSGCSRMPFAPTVSDALTSRLASNPSGLDLRIDMPNKGLLNPEAEASEAQFKRAEVIFPKGVTVNPSIAEGLAVCSEAAYARERYDSKPGVGCPEASKIGSVQIATPLLEEEASGAVYQATPYDNATHSLIGLYLVAKIPDRGILVKQPIEVRPDPATGQLVSIADEVPQLPFTSFKFHFREGGRSPLVTPPGCGTFATVAKFTPWSAQDPENPDPSEVVERTATFTVDHGVDGGACPSGPAPFHPGFEAGTLNNQAGSYSPFVMRLTRGDGEQDMGRFSFVLPPGVVPKLAGIPYCPDAAIAKAASRQGPHGGAEELNDPSCPAASQIGRTVAGAGVGNQLTYVPGKLYLAGPYHGDPISAVSITPAVAGPFDAGVVVVREALRLNPVTHVGEVDGAASDPIPHILKGIPLNLRDLRVYADKPEFTLNATSCDPFKALSTIWGDGTALAPLGETPVGLSSRYQAAGCASLGFKPRLAIKLKGGTKRGGHPALKAIVTPRAGDANFAGAVVTLPHSAFLDQAHIRTICTRVQFAAGAGNGAECPAASQYGFAKAWTPLLDAPLEGPVFLRSSDHNLPDLVLALHGLVNIDLASRIDSFKGGIRSSFEDVPDAPVSRFVLEMQGGKKGLIVNSTNLCASTNRAKARITGQNGKVDDFSPLVRASGCPKKHKKKHRRHHKRHKAHRRHR